MGLVVVSSFFVFFVRRRLPPSSTRTDTRVPCTTLFRSLEHAAWLCGLRVGLGVALDDVDVGHDDLVAMHAHHVAALALVLAGGDHHVVALLDSHHVILSSTCDRIASSSPYLSKRSEHFGRERDDLHELLGAQLAGHGPEDRSEEHTYELQSLMRISYSVLFL